MSRWYRSSLTRRASETALELEPLYERAVGLLIQAERQPRSTSQGVFMGSALKGVFKRRKGALTRENSGV